MARRPTALWLTGLLLACQSPPDFATGAGPGRDEPSSCDEVTAVPDQVVQELKLDTDFYGRHCQALGIDVLGSSRVPDAAMLEAGRVLEGVFEQRAELRDAVHDRYFRVVLVASSAGEELDDVPELGDLRKVERMAAGLGPDAYFPAATVRDSAVLCRPADKDPNATPPGDTLVHELGHALLSMGLVEVDPGFEERLIQAFEGARAAGTWAIEVPPVVEVLFGELPSATHMMGDHEEYWATGVSAWFGFKPLPLSYALTDDDPPGIQLQVVYGRDALRGHDPALADLLEEVFGPSPGLRPSCVEWIPRYR
ncbi:MAG: hypothetical protein OEZ06_01315 [Myxococcales bacterium]|nr:hypothetical protein [Myxococcales bacterium]